MDIAGRVIVITGAASGVGAGCARRFAADGAKVVLTDINAAALNDVAAEVGAPCLAGDIGLESIVQAVAALAREHFGRIDIWFSNAGFSGKPAPGSLPPVAEWQRFWDLHVMSHVHAARAVLPEMIERGEGYLLQTASAVALSVLVDKAHYTVTKTAALSLSEWLAVNFRSKGVRVSCFCPGAMDTAMLRSSGLPDDHPALESALKPHEVADLLVRGIAAETFLIDSTGPVEGATLLAHKATDYEAWFAAATTNQ